MNSTNGAKTIPVLQMLFFKISPGGKENIFLGSDLYFDGVRVSNPAWDENEDSLDPANQME